MSNNYKEPITPEALHGIIDYIDDGGHDIDVIKSELGELILRHTGEYFGSDSNSDKEPKYLKVQAHVRYWDGAIINGNQDENGSNVPSKNGDIWEPVVDLEKGKICDWPDGVKADFHFKVCDAGSYYLLDSDRNVVGSIIEDYVPYGLCHGDQGYGDYIIFSVDEDGFIKDYKYNIKIDEWED